LDGLSGAASSIAVVSLTFQILESISKLHEFVESMRMAPREIKLITKDLTQLSAILRLDDQRYDDVLITCMEKIDVLSTITDELELGFQSAIHKQRRWTAFRKARKGAILKRLRETLEETKSNLSLALQAKNLSSR
jgi:hypothetical protein